MYIFVLNYIIKRVGFPLRCNGYGGGSQATSGRHSSRMEGGQPTKMRYGLESMRVSTR